MPVPAPVDIPPTTATDTPVMPPDGTSLDPMFPSCTAAKAAGYGPYRSGVDPEYVWYRDRDGDGVVCE
jgi:micrococcal nuclease